MRIRRNGFVFDPHDHHELARILGVLAARPDLREAMGLAGREIVNRFSCENFDRNAHLAVLKSLQA